MLALVLFGCSPAAGPEMSPQRSGVTFVPDANGLGLAGRAQRIDFGRAPSGVIAALDREMGRGVALGLVGCPEGVVTQRGWGTLVLTFTAEKFVGWQQTGARAGKVCAPAA